MTIRGYQQAVAKINLKQATKEAIKDSEEDIVGLQELQWDRGERRTGKPLPEYSIASVEIFGKSPGTWTLKDTGSFRGKLEIKNIDDMSYEITSSDSKTAMLVNKAGATIFGLNATTRAGSVTNEPLGTGVVLPKLKKRINQQAGLTLFKTT